MILTESQAADVFVALAALDDLGCRVHVTVHMFGVGVVDRAPNHKIAVVSSRGVEHYSCHEAFAEAYELD